MDPGSLDACLPPSSSTPGEGAGAAGAPPRGATSRATSSRCCSSMSLGSSRMQQHLRLLPATACSLPCHLRLLTKATIAGGRRGRHLGPPPPPPPPAQHPCMVSLRRRGASSWGHDAMTPPRLPGIVSCGTQALWGPAGMAGMGWSAHSTNVRRGRAIAPSSTRLFPTASPYHWIQVADPAIECGGKASWG